MPRILFWNVNKRNLTEQVCSLATENFVDVVVLNECSVPDTTTLEALQMEVSPDFYIPKAGSRDRFHCFCRNSGLDMSEVHSGVRISVRRARISSLTVLVALVHGVDIRNYDAESRISFAHDLAREIRFVTEEKNTNRLLMVGDFNMNPYERGMNLAAGLNALMTKSCVQAGQRQFVGKKYDLYYNPMWSLFGDNTDGPAGTVYDTSNQGPYGWSILDQALLSHSIIDLFEDVKILTETGAHSLKDRQGRPDSQNMSDHFPIMLTLKESIDD